MPGPGIHLDVINPINRNHWLNRGLVTDISYLPGISNVDPAGNPATSPTSRIPLIIHNLVGMPMYPSARILADANAGVNNTPHCIAPAGSSGGTWMRTGAGGTTGATNPRPGSGPDSIVLESTGATTFGNLGPSYGFADVSSPYGWTFGRDVPFSAYMWMWFSQSTPGTPLCAMDAAVGGWDFTVKVTTFQARLRLWNPTTVAGRDVQSGKVLTTRTWWHVGFTYDGSNTAAGIKFYFNGELDPVGGYTTNTNTDPGASWSITPTLFQALAGGAGGLGTFNGHLDQLRVFNREISQSEMMHQFQESANGSIGIYNYVRPAWNNVYRPPNVINLAGVVAGQSGTAGAIANSVTLPATTCAALTTTTASLSKQTPFIGTIHGQSVFTTVLTGPLAIFGTIAAHSTTAGNAVASWSLKGVTAGQATLQAVPVVLYAMQGAVAGQAATTAKLVSTWAMQGSLAAQSTTTEVLGDTRLIAGVTNAVSTTAAVLSTTKTIKGTSAAQAGTAAALSAEKLLAGLVDCQGVVLGKLVANLGFTVTVNAQSLTTAALSRTRPLQGALAGQATVVGLFDRNDHLKGIVNGVSFATAGAKVDRRIAGVSSPHSTAGAALAATKTVAGSLAGTSTATARPTRSVQVQGSVQAVSFASTADWTPLNLATLPAAGYSPDAIAGPPADNTEIASYLDRTGHGLDLSRLGGAGSGPTFKTGILNGKPILRFNGTGFQGLRRFTVNIASPFTLLFVINTTQTDLAQRVWFGTPYQIGQGNVNGSSYYYNGVGAVSHLGDIASWHSHACVFNGATSFWHRDGSIVSGPDSLGTSTMADFNMGGNYFTAMDLADCWILPYVPTQQEIDKWFGYSNWKYGLNSLLPGGHPYKSAPPVAPLDPPALHVTWSLRGVVPGTSQVSAGLAGTWTLAGRAAAQSVTRANLGTVLTQGPYKPAALDGFTPGVVAADGYSPTRILAGGGAGLQAWEFANAN